MLKETHKGWDIQFNPPPIPVRDFDWVAIHPDYEGWMQDGDYVSNGLIVHAPNKTELIKAIEDWEHEHD